ncbi:MAG: ankyrin repeat domain-containing protein [bacterium]
MKRIFKFGIVVILPLIYSVVYCYASSEELLTAIRDDDIEQVKVLIQAGVDINAQDETGWITPLMQAAFTNSFYITKLLIENGVDVNAKNNSGFTALIFAVAEKSLIVSRLLIEAGADVNVKGDNGLTPLMVGALNQSYALVNLLLEKGADINLKNSEGKTVIMLAGEKDYDKIVALLESYRELKTSKEISLTAPATKEPLPVPFNPLAEGAGVQGWIRKDIKLINAARGNSLEAVKSLIKEEVDINAVTGNGTTALMWAAFHNSPDIAGLLLEKGADVNFKNNAGMTALIFAAGANSLDMAKLLLENGADMEAVSVHGVTSLIAADTSGYEEMRIFLTRYKTKRNEFSY